MRIKTTWVGPVVILGIHGTVIDFVDGDRICETVFMVLDRGGAALIFDIRKISRISYLGLSAVARVREAAAARGLRFEICGPPSGIAPLAYARILLTYPTADSLDDALADLLLEAAMGVAA